jgi:large subunit ribosomal protein L9
MKIILKETVESLGRRGSVVDVKPGYARNYLIPHHLADIATNENIRRVEADRREYLAREAKRIEEAQEIAVAIGKLQLTVTMKASEDGHLFGSVSERVVADALAAEKIVIDPKMVRMDQHLREVGVYDVKIHLHPEVDVTAKLWVVADKTAEAAPVEE